MIWTFSLPLVRPYLEMHPFLHNHLRQDDKVKLESLQQFFPERLLGLTHPSTEHPNLCLSLTLQAIWIHYFFYQFSGFAQIDIQNL